MLGTIDPNIVTLIQAYQIGTLRRYRAGSVLFQQGDPSTCVFVVKSGAVKVYSLCEAGKEHTYGVLGAGRLVGTDTLLVGERHGSTAEVVAYSEIYILSRGEFEHLMTSYPAFSRAVIQEMAQTTRDLTDEIQGLVFLDVMQRLKSVMIGLAQQHGNATRHGTRIDLDLTHEELAALVGADRSTITLYLNELVRQGYMWREGRRYVILPLQHIEILDGLSLSVIKGDEEGASDWARKALQLGVDPIKALDMLTGAMKQVDKAYRRDELALSDVMLAVYATKYAMPIIEEELQRTRRRMKKLGKIVIGTVRGDIHDIGKTIVSTMLIAAGFEIIDLGVDVAVMDFVDAVEEYRPEILAMSAFLTTTASEPEQIIGTLKENGLRDQVHIIVGGGAMTQELSQQAGGDGYEHSADGAIKLAKQLIGAEQA